MHDVTIAHDEPIRDSEGLLVTGLPRLYRLKCETCGWTEVQETPELAIVSQQVHGKTP